MWYVCALEKEEARAREPRGGKGEMRGGAHSSHIFWRHLKVREWTSHINNKNGFLTADLALFAAARGGGCRAITYL